MKDKKKKAEPPGTICIRCLGSGNLDPVDRGGAICPDCKGTGKVQGK